LRQGRHDVRDRGWQWCLMTWRSIALRASLRNHPHQVTAGLIGMCVWGCLQSRDCSETAVCDGFDSKSENNHDSCDNSPTVHLTVSE
jgi:hypothetical protein